MSVQAKETTLSRTCGQGGSSDFSCTFQPHWEATTVTKNKFSVSIFFYFFLIITK